MVSNCQLPYRVHFDIPMDSRYIRFIAPLLRGSRGECFGVPDLQGGGAGLSSRGILAVGAQPGRRINDGMGKFVAENTVKEMIRAGLSAPARRSRAPPFSWESGRSLIFGRPTC